MGLTVKTAESMTAINGGFFVSGVTPNIRQSVSKCLVDVNKEVHRPSISESAAKPSLRLIILAVSLNTCTDITGI